MPEKPSPQRGTNPPTRDVNAAQRVSLAIKLRASKMTYEAIAKQCGYSSASACRKAVMRELERCVSHNVAALRLEELGSLEVLERECWKIFVDKKREKAQLFAVDRILAIMERRAKLMGLDQTPDMAAAVAQVVIREVPAGYLGLGVAPSVQGGQE